MGVDTPSAGAPGGVRSVHTALRIMEELSHRQPIGVSELARTVGLPKSSVYRSLRTLQQAGWAGADTGENPRWSLTHKVFKIGLNASADTTLREHAVEEMTGLRDTYGETVHLTVPDDDELVVIARIDGTNSLRTFLELGTRAPMVSTAGGRAMLSAMPENEVERLLQKGVTTYTDRTKVDHQAIWDEVRQAQSHGYATNAAEWRTDIAAIAAPIVSNSGRVLAAISVSMPMTHFQEIDLEAAGKLVNAACERVRNGLTGI